jgi:hypothetical protein
VDLLYAILNCHGWIRIRRGRAVLPVLAASPGGRCPSGQSSSRCRPPILGRTEPCPWGRARSAAISLW